MKPQILIILITLIISGCSHNAARFITATLNPLSPNEMVLYDGHKGIYYTLQKEKNENIDTLLFFITGSGHTSLNYYLESYFKNLNNRVKVYSLQKRYIAHTETGIFEASREFHLHNTFTQHVDDQRAFIKYILESEDTSRKKIVLYGVSEGGSVATALASELPQISHLVILGSGGMKGIDEFRIWGERHHIDFDSLYETIKKDPDNIDKKAVGQTYKYWSSFLSVDPMDYFTNIHIPILVAIGEKDQMTPIETVHFLQNEFNRLNRSNLLVKIYEDCDHRLTDSDGTNHRAELLQFSYQWWNSQ